jgi:hypothetical protein
MGQAVVETVPQFMPHMIVSSVDIEDNVPDSSDVFSDAAVVGSTVMTLA